MTKSNITQYDNTAANNTDVEDVPLGENLMYPSHVNNAFREIMADLADINDGTVTLTSPAAGSINITSNITVGGTVDGRDVAADGTKLDGIEASATADQTAAEIRALVESATDSNVFTDADHTKLNGIETGATADQTKSDIDALGIDAATLDGIDSTSFLRSDTSDTMAGNLTVGDGTNISMSAIGDGQLMLDGNGYTGAIALNANGMHIYNNSGSRYISFGINETEEMRLETDGDLHVDGNVVAYSTTISDIRLKKDVAPIEDAVTKVQQLNGCTFTYLKDDRKSAGLIAQDVEKVLPSAVIEDEAVFHGEEGETYKTVQYDQVIGLLVEAVKELKAEIEELKNGTAK